nr:NAD(P)H-binding protein [Sphingomonas sp. CDS-1]
MRIFVVGGRGHVGSLVAEGLAAKGADVRVLTRNAASAESMPKGQTTVIGDLDCISVLQEEMSAADGVFLMHPPQDTLSFKGLNAVSIASETRPGNVVLMTAVDVDGNLVGVGHCGGMWPTEIALGKSGLSYTILRPNYFFQNDERQRANIEQRGVYGSPLGDVGLSRVDVRDIADAAVASFEKGSTGQRYIVGGPEVFNGAASAALWSEVLRKPIAYGGHADMKRVQAYLQSAGLPEHWAYDLCKMYEVWQRHGSVSTQEDLDRLSTLIQHEPRTYKAFAEELAREWAETPLPDAISWGQ